MTDAPTATAPSSEAHAAYYRAISARDASFDGRFFTAVRTTGIYCRPVCPARTPARRNVTFFPTAAAAEQAGYRPCRRCRPETAPGSPAWRGTEALVIRAVRCIDEGALDHGSVRDLADRLGVGTRQLNRLFQQHLGVGPARLARSRRAHFARTLLDGGGDASMASIAHAAGFRSVRRFNAVMREVFGQTPTTMRGAHVSATSTLVFRIRVASPYDFEALLRWMEPRAFPGVEVVDLERGCYRRVLRFGSDVGRIRVSRRPSGLALELDATLLPHALPIVRATRRTFDTDVDIAAVLDHFAPDPLLAEAVSVRPGLRLPGAYDPFEIVVRAILGQQVSVAAAATLARRLVDRFAHQSVASRGPSLGDESGAPCPERVFPSPESLQGAPLEDIGMISSRATTLRTVAALFARDPAFLSATRDPTADLARLRAVRGVGPWTESYVALRALHHADAFPAGDLILKRMLAVGTTKLTTREAERRVAALRPYRGYAAMHLWAAYSARKEQP